MKVLVIDDEPNVRKTTIDLLVNFCEGIEHIEEAEDIETAKVKLTNFKPDVVFADVVLKDKTAMDLFSTITVFDFQIVFMTAFEKYAIDAFKFSAIDFLLKPIDPLMLSKAVTKAKSNFDKESFKQQITVLQNSYDNHNLIKNDKIVLKDSEAIHFVKIKNIIYCEADGPYTTFFLENQEKIIVSKTIKEYDDLLIPFGFIRTHQTYLVNKVFVKKYKKFIDCLILDNGKEIPVSQRKKESVLDFLKS